MQCEEIRLEIGDKLERAKTIEKKNRIITQQIYTEYFYYNPVYKKLLEKRTEILKKNEDNNAQTRANNFLLTLPSLQQIVKYKKRQAINVEK